MERRRDTEDQNITLDELEREERDLHRQRDQMLANLQAVSGALQLIDKLKAKLGEQSE